MRTIAPFRTVSIVSVLCLAASAQSSAPATFTSAASPNVGIAPDSLVSAFGQQISIMNVVAPGPPWPTMLGDISAVLVKDSTGKTTGAGILFVSPSQMNIWIPPGVAAGPGTISFPVTGLPPGAGTAALRVTPVNFLKVAPGLFSADGTGSGVAAAETITIVPGGPPPTPSPIFICDAVKGCGALAITLGVDTPVYLSLFGTGIRGASSLQNVSVTIGNTPIQPTYAGPQLQYPGLDQVNVLLPLNLRGAGLANVTITVDNVTSNPVQIDIR